MYSSQKSALAIFLGFACVFSTLASIQNTSPLSAYGSQKVSVATLPKSGEAQASANSNNAGAQAAAAQINQLNQKKLDIYGTQIGIPLLAKPYPPITNLYAAALPPRSFVGNIEPGFYKDSYGNIKYQGESSIAVAVV